MTTSKEGKQFIKDYEKLRLHTYDDSLGYATIGYGHLIAKKSIATIKNSKKFQMLKNSDIYANGITKNEILNGITEDRANQLFDHDLPYFENKVKKNVKVTLHQYEFDALVSLVYNTGHLFPHLLQKLNSAPLQGDDVYSEVAEEFRNITNHGVAGLIKRRTQEIDIFDHNIYNSKH